MRAMLDTVPPTPLKAERALGTASLAVDALGVFVGEDCASEARRSIRQRARPAPLDQGCELLDLGAIPPRVKRLGKVGYAAVAGSALADPLGGEVGDELRSRAHSARSSGSQEDGACPQSELLRAV